MASLRLFPVTSFPTRQASTNLRKLTGIAALALLPSPLISSGAPTPDLPQHSQTRWETRAERGRQLTRNVVWLSHEPLDFLVRRGGEHFGDEPARYQTMSSPENLRLMAAAGVRYGQIYFYKGLGLDYERSNFENAKRVIASMHELGMKTSVYIGGTMFTETLYHEVPEAEKWERRDQNGQWISYGTQTFRHYACFNEPAYRDYIKKVIRYAVVEAKTDEVFFDNVMLQPEPYSCRCPRCLRAFQAFLHQRYPSPAVVRRRFGLPDLSWIKINEWESPQQPAGLTELNDPVLQEWVRFRCEYLAQTMVEFADYAKSLNPKVSVTLNLKGVYTFNRYWTNAVYQPLYAGHFDAIDFDTGGFDAGIDAGTGALVSQIRSYKMNRRLGVSSIDFIQEDDLRAAVHMAFGYQKPNPSIPGAPWHEGLNNVFTPLLEFFREYNDRYYTATETIADVAVMHTWPTIAYTLHEAYVPSTLVEQVLIQHRVPFDFLYEEEFGRLNQYRVVVLAGQECLSDQQIAELLGYVRAGGTLVLTDNTGQYNEWREFRRTNPLFPARTEGTGRIVYIPKVIPSKPQSRSTATTPDPEPGAALQPGAQLWPANWTLPFNHKEIAEAVRSGLPAGGAATANAPLTTVMELLKRTATKETLVHFVNFDRTKPVAPFAVSVRSQYATPVEAVTCFAPNHDQPIPLKFVEKNGTVTFTAPTLDLYSMIVISHQ